MRILYLNNDKVFGTGSGNFLNNLVNSLKKINPNWGYSVLTKEDLFGSSFIYFPFYFLKIRNIFKKNDIIHALDGWPYGFIAVFCSIGLKNRVIITAIGTGAIQPLYKIIKKQLLTWSYKRADKITAISNNTKKEILKVVPNLKIEVINHGVDFDKFQNIQSKDIEEISKLKPYILSVGTLKKRKGLENSLKAFVRVSGEFDNVRYVIVGKGPDREKLNIIANSYNVLDKVVFLNKVDEDTLIGLYKNTELFILLPQDSNKDIEGFGLVFLEAAACGAPVIGSKDTSAEDAVLDGENGFLVYSEDTDSVSDCIMKILKDNDLKSKFSDKSIEFAKYMSWDKAAKGYISIYR